MKVNTKQTPTSTSALVNGAAKDDAVTLSSDNTFSLSDLLANDPGSAKYVSYSGAGISYDAGTKLFTVTDDVAGFDYTIRMANGTFSTGHVTLSGYVPPQPHAGDLLFTDNFSSYTTADPWATVDLTTNAWTSTGAATEVVKDGYQGIDGNDGGYWLDTQGSPGGIDITHTVADANGGQAQLTLSLASQEFDSYLSSGTLEVYWNGVVVETVTAADFAATNTFQNFTVIVSSNAGNNTLEIKDTGASFVGFALDAVHVNDWVI